MSPDPEQFGQPQPPAQEATDFSPSSQDRVVAFPASGTLDPAPVPAPVQAAERYSRSSTDARLVSIFTYQSPRPDQIPQYNMIRAAALEFARVIVANTLPCADQTAAIRKVREAVMTANAAIALDGLV